VFERFTDRARRVVVLAQEEARLLNHNYIGTEHILLGLIHEGEGVAAQVLESLGISLDSVRSKVDGLMHAGDAMPDGHIPFTPRAKKVLELSLREALQLGHNYIGTEHILLGLIREGDGVAAQVLTELGADLPRIRSTTIQVIGGMHSGRFSPTHTAAASRVDRRARSVAGGLPIGTHHQLLAMFDIEDSLAARVLMSAGLTRDAVDNLIKSVGVAGTSDEMPPSGRNHNVTVRVENDKVLVEIADPDLADLMGQALTLVSGTDSPEMSSDDPAARSFDHIWRATRSAATDVFRRLATRVQQETPDDIDPPTSPAA
jgi:ATP-dependent Clp protease ATP-binding subunit ClpA